MPYRPRIPDDVHQRVEHFTLGKRINDNELYIQLIKIAYSNEGEQELWLKRLQKYNEETEEDVSKALNKVIPKVIDEDGTANIQFKEKLDLKE